MAKFNNKSHSLFAREETGTNTAKPFVSPTPTLGSACLVMEVLHVWPFRCVLAWSFINHNYVHAFYIINSNILILKHALTFLKKIIAYYIVVVIFAEAHELN